MLVSSSCTQNSQATPAVREETLPFYDTADFDAEWIPPGDARLETVHVIEDFALQNQLGETVTNQGLRGSVYVANFFFASCTSICPKMANNFRKLQQQLVATRQVKLVSFSVMPWVDTVEKLGDYAKVNAVDPAKWLLLTGDKEKIYHLARASFFAEKSLGLTKTSNEFLHTESMLLIDKQGRIRGIYNATQKPDVERVMHDIGVLLKE